MVKIQFENNVTKANADTFNTMQDNIEDAINNVSIDLDDEVSTSSTNGVENQAITNYVNNKILDSYSTSNTSTYSCNYINNNSGGTEVYSTTETLTNKVWIDGKPIYRKVIIHTCDGSSSLDISHNISNLGEVIRCNYLNYASSNGNTDLPHNTLFTLSINRITSSKITGSIASAYDSSWELKIILEYTKTTD